jgi:hypothetical protein
MPEKVGCPRCGADGTPAANSLLQEKLNRPVPRPEPAGRPQPRSRFGLGLLGALSAAIVAMLGWFWLIKLTGYPLGFAAWGVGLLVGLGARELGQGGSRRLGLAAAACALVAILTGQLLAASQVSSNAAHSNGLGWLTLLWLLMAVLSAFKLASNSAR